jgi:hypothetical protein
MNLILIILILLILVWRRRGILLRWASGGGRNRRSAVTGSDNLADRRKAVTLVPRAADRFIGSHKRGDVLANWA